MKESQQEPEITPYKSKKDTKKWCHGKPDKEHKKEWVKEPKFIGWYNYSCVECGKIFDYCTGWFGRCICGKH